jgi:hypothetical protein
MGVSKHMAEDFSVSGFSQRITLVGLYLVEAKHRADKRHAQEKVVSKLVQDSLL